MFDLNFDIPPVGAAAFGVAIGSILIAISDVFTDPTHIWAVVSGVVGGIASTITVAKALGRSFDWFSSRFSRYVGREIDARLGIIDQRIETRLKAQVDALMSHDTFKSLVQQAVQVAVDTMCDDCRVKQRVRQAAAEIAASGD